MTNDSIQKMFTIKQFVGANTLFGDVAQQVAEQCTLTYGPFEGPQKFTQFMEELSNETVFQ